MAYQEVAKNAMLDELATIITQVSLHTASPPSDVNEVSGGSYARQSITFGAASGGLISATNQPSFDVPGGTTVSAVAFRATDGTIYADDDVTDETFASDGTYTINTATLDLNA